MDPVPSENTLRQLVSAMDRSGLERLWKLQKLTDLHEEHLQELQRLHDKKQLNKLLELTKKAPQNIKHLIDDKLEKAPVDDYVIDIETRSDILDRTLSIAKESTIDISAALFAVIMVAPVDVLKSRLAQLEECKRLNDQAGVNDMLAQWKSIALDGIRAFANRGGHQRGGSSASASSVANSDIKSPPGSNKPSPQKRQRKTSGANSSGGNSPSSSIPPSPSKRSRGHGRSASDSSTIHQTALTTLLPPIIPGQQLSIRQALPSIRAPANVDQSAATSISYSRSTEAVKLCKERDNHICCFTGMRDPQAAHIFPFAVSKNGTTSRITAILEMFWDPDTKERLSDLIGNRKITESPKNLISINHQLHDWFDSCKLALKPLEKMTDGIRVQFHWLNKSNYKPDSVLLGDYNLESFMETSGIKAQTWGNNYLAHRASGLHLLTGQTFILKSKNPDHIPDFDLLELSWNLLRMAAICGASGELEELSDDDDHEEAYSDVEIKSTISDENNNLDIYQWIGEANHEVEMENDIDAEADQDSQPDDDARGPF